MDWVAEILWTRWQHSHGVRGNIPMDQVAEIRGIRNGAPQAHDLAVSALTAAHFVLIPVQPSPYDIWATADLVELVKQRIELTEGQLQAAFLISRSIRNTKLGQEVTEALADYALPILSVRIMQRVLYPTTAAAGTTVLDTEPHGEAAKEIRALMQEIKEILH